MAFAAGLVTPATLFVLVGNRSLAWFRTHRSILGRLNTVMNGVLVLTGAYVVMQERLYTFADVLAAAAITTAASVALVRSHLGSAGHARLTALAVAACNLAPLVPFLLDRYAYPCLRAAAWHTRSTLAFALLFGEHRHSTLHPADGGAAGKCPAAGPGRLLCQTCYLYSALHVSGTAVLCMYLLWTGLAADRRSLHELRRLETKPAVPRDWSLLPTVAA